jgi:hypothetical protein
VRIVEVESSYKAMNVLGLLDRDAVVLIDDEWVRDEKYYFETEEIYTYYLNFLAQNNFFVSREKVLGKGVKEAVVTRGDLTDDGWSFWLFSNTKWLNYYDRNRDKPLFNAQKKLEDLLKKWRESQQI